MSRPQPPTRRRRRVAAGAALAVAAGTLLVAPATAAPTAPTEDGLLLHYAFDAASGSTVTDISGNGLDGTLEGDPSYDGGAVVLDGTDDHVSLPDDVLTGLTEITVSTDVRVDPAQQGNYFLWNLGGTVQPDPWRGTGHMFATGDGVLRAAVTPQWWNAERGPRTTSRLSRGQWHTITYTQSGTTGVLYDDGVEVARATDVTTTPAELGGGSSTHNVIGESAYAGDSTLRGRVGDFRLYGRALSADEVAGLAPSDADRVADDVAALDLGDLTAVTDDLTLPTSGEHGSDVTWASSAPAVISTTGEVTRPAAGSEPADVVLTATVSSGAVFEEAAFGATVLPEADDATRAAEAAEALSLVNADDVRGHLTLPTTGRHGATVGWASSAPATVTTDGLVTRPAVGSGDAAVTLTATVTVGDAETTREFPLTVREAHEQAEYEGYAFSYFVNNSVAGEKIYVAASDGNDALAWDELNDGQPVLESTYGERGLRDPFLIRSPEGDRFFLIATDLSIGRNGDWDRAQRTGSRHLEVWESTDLVTWSEQRHVEVAPETAGNTWAPEAYWDDELQSYVVFWASKLYAEDDPGHTGTTYNRMMYATTRDFVTFSDAKVWQDRGESRIDSTVIEQDGTYYRFTKDEGGGGTGCSDIIQEKNDSLTAVDTPGAPAWEFMAGCIGRDAGTGAVEGPTVFAKNPGDTSPHDYYLFVDEYGGRGYIPLGTDDLERPDWSVPASYDLPASPRHGTVIPVTADELETLRTGLGAPSEPTPPKADEDGLVLDYDFDETAGTTVTDSSGNGHDAVVEGGGTWSDGALSLDGTDDHVAMPDDLMAGAEEITVSTRVRIDESQGTPYWLYGLGNTASGAGNGYLFTTGDALRSSLTTGSWQGEQTANAGRNAPRGTWVTLTYTLADGVAVLYADGVEVARNERVSIVPGDIGDGRTTANRIGRSLYSGDRFLSGDVDRFTLWNRALSADEVADADADPTAITGVELDELKVPAIVHTPSSTVTLPVVPGTDLTALDPSYDVAPGSTVTPDGPVDLTEPVTLTVTGADSSTREWTVRAVEMRTPMLPGKYADPNIAEFDGTYYVYATTDGTPGWGGKDFYVWSSDDLVDWTRSEEPFLTLDGDDGNVPWATGNAWAPTVIERDGRYYFYFSGHNPTYDRKTIGVAVADSPEGPFTAEPTAMITNGESVRSGQAIDPAAYEDPETGKHYLFWGNGSPLYAELDDDMTSIRTDTIRRIEGLPDFREGLFMNHRDGTYHLTYSIDDTGSPNYRVGYATSDSVDGPWTYRGVILEKDESQGILGPAHSSIVQVPGRDEWYVAYHRFAIPGGNGTNRETTIDRLTFGEDGLIEKVVPTLTGPEPLETLEAPVAGDRPGVVGGTVVGGRLRTDGGTWTGGEAELAYQWLRDTRPIAGATARTYTPRPADVGHRISVRVTATNAAGQDSASAESVGPVRRARSEVTAALKSAAVKARAANRLDVAVVQRPGRAAAPGWIRVLLDGRVVDRLRLDEAGEARTWVKVARPGRYRVAVRYNGSAGTEAGTSDELPLRVVRR